MTRKKISSERSPYSGITINLTPQQRTYLESLAWRTYLHSGTRPSINVLIGALIDMVKQSHDATQTVIHPALKPVERERAERAEYVHVATARLPPTTQTTKKKR